SPRDRSEAELREELPRGLREEVHSPHPAAAGEIEGGYGECRPEPLTAELCRHGDGAEQRGVAVQLERCGPDDGRLVARHERTGDVLLDAGARQLARGEQREDGRQVSWDGGCDVGRHVDVRSPLARGKGSW